MFSCMWLLSALHALQWYAFNSKHSSAVHLSQLNLMFNMAFKLHFFIDLLLANSVFSTTHFPCDYIGCHLSARQVDLLGLLDMSA